MSGLDWGPAEEGRLAAIRDDLARVSTASHPERRRGGTVKITDVRTAGYE
jgi:hypothetical protein